MSSTIDPKNSMLIDVQYVRANKKAGKPDTLYTIYKDLKTNKKHVIKIDEPMMPIYFEKESCIDHIHPIDYQYISNCDMKVCKYRDIPFEIAKHSGESGKRFLNHIHETGNYKDLKLLNTYPYVFGHDFDIRTYYRYAWRQGVDKDMVPHFNKAFGDIEVDSFDETGWPHPEISPIDLMTIIDGESKTSYTFALVNRPFNDGPLRGLEKFSKIDNKSKEIYEKRLAERQAMFDSRHEQEKALMDDTEGLKEELHKLFDEAYPGFDYKFYFYEDERKMLIHIFQCIHLLSPDFMEFWNIGFDIPYILDRMRTLGLNPNDIICDEEFKDNNECRFVKDTRNFDIKNKSDHFICSSKTVYVDQMELYAAIRKGREELRNFRLNYIAKKEINDEKYDYSDDGGNLKTLGYLNYRKYFIYNIKDVLLQYAIEEMTEDIDALYSKSYANITSYADCFKQTVVLRNVQYRIYQEKGHPKNGPIIPGANVNQIYLHQDMAAHPERYTSKAKKEVGFEGAIVGDVRLIQKFGKKMYGKRTNYLFQYSVDFDMSAFYPSTIIELNISPSTLLFKMSVEASNYDVRGGEIPYHGITDVQLLDDNKDSFSGDIAAEIVDNFQCGNIISTGHKFMNLPTIAELEEYVIKNRKVG